MQKKNRDWFRLKHRTNSFSKPQSYDGRVVEWKRKILQEVDNKIISLKHRIKVHKRNPVLKQDAIIEYLNKLHERYALVPKLYKNPVGSRFIIASKNCSTPK